MQRLPVRDCAEVFERIAGIDRAFAPAVTLCRALPTVAGPIDTGATKASRPEVVNRRVHALFPNPEDRRARTSPRSLTTRRKSGTRRSYVDYLEADRQARSRAAER